MPILVGDHLFLGAFKLQKEPVAEQHCSGSIWLAAASLSIKRMPGNVGVTSSDVDDVKECIY
jgi:hypothetical protein